MAAVYKLADRRWKVQLAGSSDVAGGDLSRKDLIRELYEFDHTWQNYSKRDEFWAKQGSAGRPHRKIPEARLKSRDNGGFFFMVTGRMYLATVFIMPGFSRSTRCSGGKYGGLGLVIGGAAEFAYFVALILTWSKGDCVGRNWAVDHQCDLALGVCMRRHFRWSVLITLLLMIAGMGVVGWGDGKRRRRCRWRIAGSIGWRVMRCLKIDHGVGSGISGRIIWYGRRRRKR